MKELEEYNIYNALLNVAEINENKQDAIITDQEEYNLEDELKSLITHLSIDDFFSANKYIHIEDNKIESRIMDEKILRTVTDENEEENKLVNNEVIELKKVSSSEAKKAVNMILRFLL
ncbi:25035_t:CDS:2, partial [Cetraspora pellucida]